MSDVSSSHLTLPQWVGGSRTVRFLYLVQPSSFSLTEEPNKDGGLPLYLGADLLSNTDVRTENHPRVHAKFAKRGLATKLQFSTAFRFQGLKVPLSNNSLWFYSIHGVLRVALELFSRREQLAVMESLQDVWKSHIDDDPLRTSYSLSVRLDACDATPTTVSAPQDSIMESSVKCGGSDAVELSADHDYCCSSPRLREHQHRAFVSTVKHKLHVLEQRVSREPPVCAQRLERLLPLLQIITQFLDGTPEEEAVSEAVQVLLKASDWGCVYSSPLVRGVAHWLGRRFHSAHSSISHRVEGFKVEHIEQISDLPPAEELVAQLFPEAMQTLLLHWMGLSEDSTLEKRRSEFPILLLILEFTNHNLITGVAHVLYSSLICK